MASELPRITIRLKDHDEIELNKQMRSIRINDKSKLFLYMLHGWSSKQEEIDRLRKDLNKERSKSEKFENMSNELLSALKIFNKYCKKTKDEIEFDPLR